MFMCHTRQRSTGAESPGSFVKEWPLIKGGGIGTDGDRQTCSLNHPYFVDFEPLLSPASCSSPTLRAELLLCNLGFLFFSPRLTSSLKPGPPAYLSCLLTLCILIPS